MSVQEKSSWGGKRPGSGRVRKNLHLDTSTSIWLKWLAGRYGKTQEQVVSQLVEAEWHKIQEVMILCMWKSIRRARHISGPIRRKCVIDAIILNGCRDM